MGYRFTLIYFLLVLFITADAQKSGKSKPAVKAKQGYVHSTTPSVKSRTTTPRTTTQLNEGTSSTGIDKAVYKDQDKITGIWKGYFVQSSFGFSEDRYRFEVQVEKRSNNSLNAVTYSYKTTVFYGKAEATGIYTKKTDNVLLKEVKMVDLKMTETNSSACLMTCYLEYSKIGSIETLTGTYTSISLNDKKDCGSGKVYLEKTTVSDFYKEDFILKKENEVRNRKKVEVSKAPAKKSVITPKAATTPSKKIIKPGAEDDLVKDNQKKVQIDPIIEEPKKLPEPPKKLPKPEVIKNRNNELVKTITTSERTFKIDLYDNGEIDGDRISVYHNNELIVSNKMLTDKAISFSIDADENDPVHEFVMVAENLGSIPPNTSLMIITAGDQRHELFVTSTEQKNAVVRIVFKPE